MCVEDMYPEDVEEQSTVDVEDIIRPRTPPPFWDNFDDLPSDEFDYYGVPESEVPNPVTPPPIDEEEDDFYDWYEEIQRGILFDSFPH